MKRLLSLLVALVLFASMSVPALATPFYIESAGATIDVPDNMTGEDASTDDYYALRITESANPNITYAYLLAYNEEYADRWLEDLTDEEGEALLANIAVELENPSFDGTEVNGYNVLIAANEAGTDLHLFSLLGGWECDIAATKNDGVALTQDEINVAAQLLTSITFDETDDIE